VIRRSATSTSPALRRTTVLAVGALLVGLPLMTACGTPHAGAAAVVDGDQITVGSLQAKVRDVRAAEAKSPNAAQLSANSSQVTGRTLSEMVFERVVARAMKDNHITVNRAEVQDFRHQQESQPGGPAGLKEALLEQQGIAPKDVNSFLRTQLGIRKIAASIGADLNTQQGTNLVRTLLANTSKESGVDINPRYGKWDNQKFGVVTSRDGWLRPSSGDAKA
jgi:SurA N-terminal domain